MVQIKWTEPALEQLNEIADYISLDKPLAAKKFVKKVFQAVSRLKNFPESGKKPKEIEDKEYREVFVNPCRVFYRYSGKKVVILYVMRSEKRFRQFMLADNKS